MCVDTNGNWGRKTETQIRQDTEREHCCRDCRSIVDVEMRSRCTGVRDLIDCAREEGGAFGAWCCVAHNFAPSTEKGQWSRLGEEIFTKLLG